MPTIPVHSRSNRGFSLMELIVTVAVIAILAALAAPSLVDSSVRNNLSSIGNDFTGSVSRARNEAVGKNVCTTMCISNNINSAGVRSDAPVCATSGQDWQTGWIVFLNESCNTSLNAPAAPADVIVNRGPTAGEYFLMAQGNTRKVNFNARGSPGLGGADRFDLIYKSVSDPKTTKYSFNICLDAVGRTRNVPADKTCSWN